MNTREQLNGYLRALEMRLRWMAVSRGAAITAGVALGATLVLVLIANELAFSPESLTALRAWRCSWRWRRRWPTRWCFR